MIKRLFTVIAFIGLIVFGPYGVGKLLLPEKATEPMILTWFIGLVSLVVVVFVVYIIIDKVIPGIKDLIKWIKTGE